MTTKPLSLEVEVHISDQGSDPALIRMSIEVADRIGFDDQRIDSRCVLVGQGKRFPSWNPVFLPVVAEVNHDVEGSWIEVPRNLDGVHLIDLDQPWDLLVVDVVTAGSISVTLDPATRGGRSRRQTKSDGDPDPEGKQFITINGDEVRVDDTEQGQDLVVDSSGAWPSIVWLTDRGSSNELQVQRIDTSKTTKVRHHKIHVAGDRKLSMVILVDCSGSMDDLTESGESRLDVARNLIYDRFEELFDELYDAESCFLDQVAIVAYGANVVRLYPEGDAALGRIDAGCQDAVLNGIRHLHSGLLAECGLQRHRSDMPLGLLYAGYLLEEGREQGYIHQILLITDGESHQVFEQPDDIGTRRVSRSPSIARQMSRLGMTVSTIQVLDDVKGVAPSQGAVVTWESEPETVTEPEFNSAEDRGRRVKEVAQRGQGESLTSRDRDALTKILTGG